MDLIRRGTARAIRRGGGLLLPGACAQIFQTHGQQWRNGGSFREFKRTDGTRKPVNKTVVTT
jgi:hypothetical protein